MNTAIATASVALIIATSIVRHVCKVYRNEREKVMGHSERCIRGNGWMLIDGEYLEG